MKKIFLIAAILCAVWAGSRSLTMNSAAAQTGSGTFTGSITPLTNQLTFTNTLVSPTNALSLELSDLVTLLLTLQTNIEATIPALNLIESNAAAPPPPVVPTNILDRRNVFRGQFGNLTSIPPPLGSRARELLLTPTGAASGTAGAETNNLTVTIGTNTFQINTATLDAIVALRDNLERTLPTLQQLNGTAPQPTNAPGSTFLNPPVANFMPLPLTNGATAPLTNATQSPF